MGILDTIEKIQAKPEHTRRQIMYVTLGICMAVVFLIWVVNFKYTLQSTSPENQTASANTSPFDYVKNMLNIGTTTQ